MNRYLSAFLHKFTFRRQLGIAVTLGIFTLAIFSSLVGSWQGTVQVRSDQLEQGRRITENLARQSVLALIFASSDNAADAANATLQFPGVVGVEIREANQRVLLKRGDFDSAQFPVQALPADATGSAGEKLATAVLDAESANAWRFTAPVYSQPSGSPFNEMVVPELLGSVTVVVSKEALTQVTSSIFLANMTTSFLSALLFLFLIRILSNRMTKPLTELSDIMGRAEAGETQVRADLAGPKDIADMAHAFNSMMAVLEERAAEISKLNAELELRVAQRTEQLEIANQELESFSYSVSHDLRMPLRAIDGFSHILLEDYADKLDDEGKRLLNVVRDNTSRMGQLIDDILNFSRTGRQELAFSWIDMEELAREVYATLPSSGDQPEVLIGHLPPATGDRAMMRQVYVNLLSNAIKFTRGKEGAKIEVGYRGGETETVYYVKDNGAGFDMQYADKLFGVFQRLHGVKEFEGTGIGLAIVKRIVNRHGGRVWAEGKVKEGAIIYFALPTTKGEHDGHGE